MAGLIVIAGPTASGKSAFALRLAEALNGVIINADSMQLYRELRIVTARPGMAELARAPHRLYGILPLDRPASAGQWLELAATALAAADAGKRLPIVVGGTGLYLKALLHGLAPVPPVPPGVRAAACDRFARLGGVAFRAALAGRDPEMAARLRPGDRQRLIRAFEVRVATGRSLADWQRLPPIRPQLPEPVLGFALLPPRATLERRIEQRLRAMIEAGALDELRALGPAPHGPLAKAVAVPEFLAHLAGAVDLETALARAIVRTRHYAKRQVTWLRHQLPELRPLHGFGDDPVAMPDPATVADLLLTERSLAHTFRPTPSTGQDGQATGR